MAKKNRLREIEQEWGESLDTLFPRLLNELGSNDSVAAIVKCHPNTVRNWRRAHRFIRKSMTVFVQEPEPDHAS